MFRGWNSPAWGQLLLERHDMPNTVRLTHRAALVKMGATFFETATDDQMALFEFSMLPGNEKDKYRARRQIIARRVGFDNARVWLREARKAHNAATVAGYNARLKECRILGCLTHAAGAAK